MIATGTSEAPLPMRVTVRLRLAADHAQTAWMCSHVSGRSDGQLRLLAEVPTAVGSRNQPPLRDAEYRILKNEIMGGAITAKRYLKRGCTMEVVAIGGAVGERGISAVPSIAFAIAANLCIIHGLGDPSPTAPRGGYGWEAESIEVVGI